MNYKTRLLPLFLFVTLAQSLARVVQGVVYSHDGQGPRMRLVRDPDPRTVAIELWRELHLSAADAAALADELRALLHRFESRTPKARRRYLIHAAIAPANYRSAALAKAE